MGVDGLWKLLEPAGRSIPKERLQAKVLAVDVSIWMNQAKNGVHARQGLNEETVCILSFFKRICALLRLGIKPVFVFDGRPPEFKQRLVERRKELTQAGIACRSQDSSDEEDEEDEESVSDVVDCSSTRRDSSISDPRRNRSSEGKRADDVSGSHAPFPQSSKFASSQAYQLQPCTSQFSGYKAPNPTQIAQPGNVRDRSKREINLRKLRTELQALLDLFGIPYVNSPGEAEAQCGYLDSVGLTNGTITEDSDIWLFGGRIVYKNFSDKPKEVVEFTSERIKQSRALDRDKMVAVAMMTGSDYGPGLPKVGGVRAMKILKQFGDQGMESLRKFKTWRMSGPEISKKTPSLLKFLHGLEIPDSFPDEEISSAYLNPVIDVTVKFVFGKPDVDGLKKYAERMFRWNPLKIAELLLPAVSKTHLKITQTGIKDFFLTVKVPAHKLSERVEKSLGRNAVDNGSENEEDGDSVPASQLAPPLSTKSGKLNLNNYEDEAAPPRPDGMKKGKSVLENGKKSRKTKTTKAKAANGHKKTRDKGPSASTKFLPDQRKKHLPVGQTLGGDTLAIQISASVETPKKPRISDEPEVIDLVTPTRPKTPKQPSTEQESPTKRVARRMLNFDTETNDLIVSEQNPL